MDGLGLLREHGNVIMSAILISYGVLYILAARKPSPL